ncbi:YihY/virulence factor BrkB family protein [Heyndrickxia acidicola]|uniref:YihY/virulence factor BrkB family protein n=1 Tax=Heyndrickxia acidicola TaxID=209389 RepID=A0ABU6MC61_9BACI|nr:YihY/virulence factor BrkB family protein [Heyndrickxia acidicola]MED1202249.1 YihY/virulence factor BrkB family protein [Heyndrickxia acidicola]
MGKTRMKIRKGGSFLKKLYERISYNDVSSLSATLAYFFLLSLFPALIFMVALLAYLPISTEQLLNTVKDFAPGDTLQLIETNLKQILSQRQGGLISIGIIASIWSASNGIIAVIKALNRAYEVDETRSFIVVRGTSIILTLGMIIVFIVALGLPVFGKQIGMYIFSMFGLSNAFLTVWNGLRWVLSPVVLFAVFTGLYYFAPNIKMKCRTVIPGAIIAAVGWIIVSLGFSFYVNNFSNYSATYGSITGIIILMLWLYFSGAIIIVGGEINALLSKNTRSCQSSALKKTSHR